jgi:SAM-dependent methyltransferase
MGLSQPDHRLFLLCTHCACVFVAKEHLPSRAEEESRYRQHKNDPTPEYKGFLSRLAEPLASFAKAGSEGLDYGCGPVPVLSTILEGKGFRMHNYDPFFFSDDTALKSPYDFISCSETAEHFHQPGTEFDKLNALLKPGGYLGVMTQMRAQWDGFFEWHYPRDPTHVIFYSPRTMRWIANEYGWTPTFLPENVVIFQKAESTGSLTKK